MTTPADSRVALDLITICGLSASLAAAQTSGLLALVLSGPRTVAECAQQLGLSERLIPRVLEVLVAAGLIQRNGERYGIAADAPLSMQLVPEWLPGLQEHFAQTHKLLETGDALPWMDRSADQREATYRSVVSSLGKMYSDIAGFLASQLDIQADRILDVGCGSGVWSLAVAERLPSSQVTGLDYPTVLELFLERAREHGLAQRVATLPGDMFQVAVPRHAFDLVIIANVLRLEKPARAQQLIQRMAGALRPGGHMLIIDALAVGTPAKELARAAYALHLALRTQEGQVHSPAQIRSWLRDAGIVDAVDVDCGVQVTALGALLGRAPA